MVRYRSNTVNNDISDLHPAFQGQHFKQSQHGVSHIVKVEITRVGPVEGQNWLPEAEQN